MAICEYDTYLKVSAEATDQSSGATHIVLGTAQVALVFRGQVEETMFA